MLTFIAIVHVIVALILVVLVLIQDSKGGGMGSAFGGSGSSSLLGATGGTNLLVKMTRYAAIIFAGTCIGLTIISSRQKSSVVSDFVPTGPSQVSPAPSEKPSEPGASEATSKEESSVPDTESKTSTDSEKK